MREIGSAAMPIIPVFGSGFKADLERGIGRPMQQGGTKAGRLFGDNAGRELTASFSKHAKRAALLASGALLGAGAVAIKIGADSVALAADLEQSIGAVDTVFGKSSKKIHKWAKGAAKDVGLSENAFNELGTLIGSQLKNGGTAMDRLAPKTKNLIALGADLSSMFGGTTQEAVESLSSALKGERDPIEKYGVTLNQAKIDAEAAALGFEKVGTSFNSQAQQAATLSLITKQTADASGNFARETDTLSHKQQVLRAQLENTKAEIGTALLPIMADAADFLLEEGVPAFQKFADWFGDEGVPALQDFGREMRPVAEEVLPAVGNAIKDIGGFLKDAAPYAKDVVEAFNDMPDWAKKGLAIGGAGLVIKSKLGKSGLFGGSSGGSLTDPAYVWVVNGGTGVGGKGGGKGGALGGVPGWLKAIPAVAASVLLADEAPKQFSGLQTSSAPKSSSINEIRKALEDSDVGKYAEDIGINLDRLAEGLATQGTKSQEFQDAVAKLEKTNEGAWEHINDLIPVVGSWITTNGDHAAFALKDLQAIVDGLSVGLGTLLNGNVDGQAGASTDITDLWSKIPEGKLKLLMDPTTEKTRVGVRDLLSNVDGLTRKDYKVLFSILGLSKAKDDAAVLLKHMRDLAGLPPLNINPFAGAAGGSGSGGGRTGGINPFARTAATGGFSIGTVEIRGSDSQRLIADMNDIARRQSIGGY